MFMSYWFTANYTSAIFSFLQFISVLFEIVQVESFRIQEKFRNWSGLF